MSAVPPEGLAAALLTAGERAAFHGRPLDGVGPLRELVEGSRDAPSGTVEQARWLLGVCLGAAGRYGDALDALSVLSVLAVRGVRGVRGSGLPAAADRPGPAPHRPLAALAAATAASLHRQLGRHAAARELDRLARELVDGPDDDPSADPLLGSARFDAELGLAADAVGLAQPAVARAHLDRAGAVLADLRSLPGTAGSLDVADGWWRQQVRLGWVRAEVALLTGEPGVAVQESRNALAVAEAAQAPRHVAKSALFLGVALREVGDGEPARASLRRAAALAAALEARPLLWPAHAVLAELESAHHGGEAGRAVGSAAAHRRAAADIVRAIAADLPADLAGPWLARPDLQALLIAG
ncbi:MAG: hypothetical protein ACTHQ3_14430 [Motilibacteraceae bacterium]